MEDTRTSQVKPEIVIEPLLYGEYYVSVYENKQMLLDKKYYVNSLEAALLVAKKISDQRGFTYIVS
jgi:hypothetical protein